MIKRIKLDWFLNIAILLSSFLFIIYTLKYSILFDHDLVYPFFRKFIEPEHGRYFATFTNSLLIEKLPILFNTHPNDFLVKFIVPIRAFFIISLICILTVSLNLFSKNKLKNFCPLTYILLFIFLFSNNYFLSYEMMQNTVFWEYPISLFPLFIFILYIMYYYINETTPNTKSFCILLLITFCVAISIEPINIPIFGGLTIASLFYTIKNKFSFKENFKIYLTYFIYIIGLIIYYCQGNDSSFEFGGLTILEYTKKELFTFVTIYFKEFILTHSKLFIPTIVLLILISILNKNEKSYKFIKLSTLGILSLVLFHFCTFFWGYNDYESVISNTYSDQTFWCNYPKFIMLYKIQLLLYLILSISFFVNVSLKIEENNIKLVNYSISLLILLLFQQPLIFNYFEEITQYIQKSKKLRLYDYVSEKILLTEDNETTYLPILLKEEMIEPYHSNEYYLNSKKIIHYPSLNNKKEIIYSDNTKIDEKTITEKEKNELIFTNLLNHKRQKPNEEIQIFYF